MSSYPRRLLPLLAVAVGSAAVLAPQPATGAPSARADDDSRQPVASDTLQLHREGPGLAVREVPVGPKRQGRRLDTGEFDLVAATWRGESRGVRVRTRGDDGWSRWRQLEEMEDLPDVHSEERTGRTGTDLVWVGGADGVQVRTVGARPRGLRLVLLDVERATEPVLRSGDRAGTRARNKFRPRMRSRRAWGANESWRNGSPRYNWTIQQVHVHHTVSGNGYTRSQVPGMIRAMYRYHTKSLGWSDIGYNFLVDKFGRVWVGRAGGPRKPVRGAHTLGFNHTSTGVAVIGDFQRRRPTKKAITGVVQLAAWKLYKYDRNPRGRVIVRSRGSDRYSWGERVRLPTIDGHRDTNQTACPGERLYDKLPRIRRRAKDRIQRYRG